MKTEYKKVSELLALENEEVLKEFEMVELKGGKHLLKNGLANSNTRVCTETNLPGCRCSSNTLLCLCQVK